MTTIEQHIDVEVPISTAYNQWTQFEEFPQFMSGVERIQQLDDTHLHWQMNVGGVKREFDAEIVEQHPDERVAWRSLEGPMHAGVVTFHRLDEGKTRVTVQLDWEPTGVAERAGQLLQVDDAMVAADLRRFKEVVEAQGVATGAWRGHVDRAPDAAGA